MGFRFYESIENQSPPADRMGRRNIREIRPSTEVFVQADAPDYAAMDEEKTIELLDYCAASGADLLVDAEAAFTPLALDYGFRVGWNADPGHEAIDAVLDAWAAFRAYCRAYAPQVRVFNYAFPGGNDPSAYLPEFIADRRPKIIAHMQRHHQRYDSELAELSPSPMDFDGTCPDCSRGTPATDEANATHNRAYLRDLREHGCPDGQLVVALVAKQRYGASWGKSMDEAGLRAAVAAARAGGAHGVTVYGGVFDRLRIDYFPFVVEDPTVAAAWNTITDGALDVWLAGVTVQVRDVDFSAAVTMDDVADTLAAAINDAVAALTIPSDDYPVHPGTVSGAWHAGSGEVRLSLTPDAEDSTIPPDAAWGRREMRFTAVTGTGTDLVGGALGTQLDPGLTVSTSTSYADYITGSAWLAPYRAMAAQARRRTWRGRMRGGRRRRWEVA